MRNKIMILANEYTTILQFRTELIKDLVKNNFEVAVVLPSSQYDNEIIELGCRVFHVNLNRHSINPFKELKYLNQLSKILKKYKPDICLSYTIKPNIFGSIACKKKRIPIIANVTGLGESFSKKGLLSRVSLMLYKIGLKKSSWVFFQNSSNMDFMIKNKAVNKDVCSLLPGSGVNLAKNPFEIYPENKKPLFITVGRMIKSKGIDELLNAIKQIKIQHEVDFLLIGKCDDEFDVKIRSMVSQGLIKYLPYQKDVHIFYKIADCVIHPSYHEGMSNVLLEAGACGRPLLASNIPGCKEIIDDGVNGYLFESKSVESLVCNIQKFLSLSKEERVKMGRNSYLKIMNNFDRNIIINEYLLKIKEFVQRG